MKIDGSRATNWALNKLSAETEKKSDNCCKAMCVAVITTVGSAITWALTKADNYTEMRIVKVANGLGIPDGVKNGGRVAGLGYAATVADDRSIAAFDDYRRKCTWIFQDPGCVTDVVKGVVYAAGGVICLWAIYKIFAGGEKKHSQE